MISVANKSKDWNKKWTFFLLTSHLGSSLKCGRREKRTYLLHVDEPLGVLLEVWETWEEDLPSSCWRATWGPPWSVGDERRGPTFFMLTSHLGSSLKCGRREKRTYLLHVDEPLGVFLEVWETREEDLPSSCWRATWGLPWSVGDERREPTFFMLTSHLGSSLKCGRREKRTYLLHVDEPLGVFLEVWETREENLPSSCWRATWGLPWSVGDERRGLVPCPWGCAPPTCAATLRQENIHLKDRLRPCSHWQTCCWYVGSALYVNVLRRK